jgi:hypothetical protein
MDDDKRALHRQWDRIMELSRWADNLLLTLPLAEAISTLEERRCSADREDRYTLTLELKHFLLQAGRQREAERIIDEMITSLPDDVRFPISKASLYLYDKKEPEKALEAIDFALARAHPTRFFRREALGVKARILLELERGRELSRTLEEIMSLEMYREIPDCGRERDFVDRAPAGLIEEDVLARYNAFCPPRERE